MSDKLELKDIACYLPYGLKCRLNRTGIFNLDEEYPQPHNEVCEITNLLKANNGWEVEISDEGMDYSCGMIGLDEIEILLRPMTDLIKPLPDGTIPIVELAKIALDNVDLPDYRILTGKYSYCIGFVEQPGLEETSFHIGIDGDMAIYEEGELAIAYSQAELFNYLYQHHFDINDLIGRGLAIDINKIENENVRNS